VQKHLPFRRAIGRGFDARGDTRSKDEDDDGRGAGADGRGRRV